MSFDCVRKGRYQIWQFGPWIEAGIVHGFIGASADFSDKNIEEEREIFKNIFNANDLFLPKQIHGNNAVDLRNSGAASLNEGDAILVCRRTDEKPSDAAGIRTADCVPIMVRGGDTFGLIHAGWRGLANGIIQNVCSQISNPSEALIGPCAGRASYEVGNEVIEAIGDGAAFNRVSSEKVLLDLEETSRNLLRRYGIPEDGIQAAGLCTISDTKFHSHRRQKEKRGSNLAFLLY